jgi:hypothetical protein
MVVVIDHRRFRDSLAGLDVGLLKSCEDVDRSGTARALRRRHPPIIAKPDSPLKPADGIRSPLEWARAGTQPPGRGRRAQSMNRKGAPMHSGGGNGRLAVLALLALALAVNRGHTVA